MLIVNGYISRKICEGQELPRSGDNIKTSTRSYKLDTRNDTVKTEDPLQSPFPTETPQDDGDMCMYILTDDEITLFFESSMVKFLLSRIERIYEIGLPLLSSTVYLSDSVSNKRFQNYNPLGY